MRATDTPASPAGASYGVVATSAEALMILLSQHGGISLYYWPLLHWRVNIDYNQYCYAWLQANFRPGGTGNGVDVGLC